MNAVNQDGRTPLSYARGRGGHANPAIEALLLAAGATAGADDDDNDEDNDEGDDEDGEGGEGE